MMLRMSRSQAQLLLQQAAWSHGVTARHQTLNQGSPFLRDAQDLTHQTGTTTHYKVRHAPMTGSERAGFIGLEVANTNSWQGKMISGRTAELLLRAQISSWKHMTNRLSAHLPDQS
jgi:hypothetical protein